MDSLTERAAHRREIDQFDRVALEKIGKETILERKFNYLSILGFSCTVLATWEAAIGSTFTWGLENGGPAGSVYGFVFVWIGSFCTFASLCELASMAPTSGGQYHWVAMLAPPSSRKYLSYLEGWLTICGWQGLVVAQCNFNAQAILALVKLAHNDFDVSAWRISLLSWFILGLALFINLFGKMLLPRFESFMLIVHILGFFATFVTLLVLGRNQTAKAVFTTFVNEGNWPSETVSFFVGLLGSAYAFVGADSAYHMAEEIYNAPVFVPLSVLLTVVLNGSLGLAVLLAALFAVSDLEEILSNPTGWPGIGLYVQVTRSIPASEILHALGLVAAFAGTAGIMATASRQLWAFARDRGVPGWRVVERVDERTSIPMYSVLLTATVTILLTLINFGSSIALNAFISIGNVGLYSSYLVANTLLLWRRCTGGIDVRDENVDSSGEITNTIGRRLVWGPWHMKGLIGIAVNLFACCYLIIVLLFAFWPTSTPVTAATMNYASAVVGAVLIVSTAYYFIRAGKVYEGPRIELIRRAARPHDSGVKSIVYASSKAL